MASRRPFCRPLPLACPSAPAGSNIMRHAMTLAHALVNAFFAFCGMRASSRQRHPGLAGTDQLFAGVFPADQLARPARTGRSFPIISSRLILLRLPGQRFLCLRNLRPRCAWNTASEMAHSRARSRARLFRALRKHSILRADISAPARGLALQVDVRVSPSCGLYHARSVPAWASFPGSPRTCAWVSFAS